MTALRFKTSVTMIFIACIGFAARHGAAQVPFDEAKDAGKTADYFTPREEQIHDYFPGMDVIAVPAAQDWPEELRDLHPDQPHRILKDVVSTKSEQLGRNTWMLWCGGNEGFWDHLSQNSHGFLDLLKVIDSRNRAGRWRDAGLVNEPGMTSVVTSDEFGIYLDEPLDADAKKYRETVLKNGIGKPLWPAITIDPVSHKPLNAFDEEKNIDGYKTATPPARVYGLSSGVVGLRLFPNPKFDSKARKRWDGKRYQSDPAYYNDQTLVRPYRVGMSCAFCHANPHPLNPPLDPANPRWENLSGSIGAQYLRMRKVFGNQLKPDNFVYHILDSQPPGTVDTSLIATDNINNPNTMNAIFGVPARVVRSFDNPREKLSEASKYFPSIWHEPAKEAPQAYQELLGDKLLKSKDDLRYVPRVLFDGADSIGVYGALARVYLNIGTHYEQWIRLHEPLIGFIPPKASTAKDRNDGRVQLPFKIEDCEPNSVYWQATLRRVDGLRDYFLKITPTMPLRDANGGGDEKRIDINKLKRGRKVFANNCIVCHSSIQPESNPNWFLDDVTVRSKYSQDFADIIRTRTDTIQSWENSREVWDHDPGQWLRNSDYRKWAEFVVNEPSGGFWRQNFLSSDFRVAVNYVGTNSQRAMATNGITGHMWEDFSSETYRKLPSVGNIAYFNPFTKNDEWYQPRHKVEGGAPSGGGGPGFYRPASLMSVWATAPLLHNNSLGHFNNDPSVRGRLEAFDDAIHKLLYIDRRLLNSDYATPAQLAADHGLIWRTPTVTSLVISANDVPATLRRFPLPDWFLDFCKSLTPMGNWRFVPIVIFLLIGFAILGLARGKLRLKLPARIVAYVIIVASLVVAFTSYFDSGGLGDLQIGPIPEGTPVSLLANINPDADPKEFREAIKTAIGGFAEIDSRHLVGQDREEIFNNRIGPALLKISKCPDFVMDKGHYFPWFYDMSDDDKESLIELIKTF